MKKSIEAHHDQTPKSRAAMIKLYSDKLLSGEITISDIGTELSLSSQEINFIELYVSRDYFGKPVESYLKAFDPNNSLKIKPLTARQSAAALLSNKRILTLMSIVLDSEGFNDVSVDKELLFTIQQHEDLKAKITAIKEYNALKSRVKQSLEIEVKTNMDYSQLTDEELKQLLSLTNKATIKEY